MAKQPEHTYSFVNPNSRREMQEILRILIIEQFNRKYRAAKDGSR